MFKCIQFDNVIGNFRLKKNGVILRRMESVSESVVSSSDLNISCRTIANSTS